MAVWDKKTLWGFLFLLAGAVGQTVIYEEPDCAVKGSTVTLPCSFTPPKSFIQRRRDVPLEMVRVLWYQSQWQHHCHLTKPFVYDSDSKTNKQRFEYLGDKKTNCTLQVRDVQERDNATFCFSMQINHNEVHFTKSRGVTLRVVEGTKMRIISSSEDKKFSRGETVTLLCTSDCTFHQLEVTWFRDGHTLSESGPSLHLGLLTAEDSGNYICALKANLATLSEPYRLQVEAEEDGNRMRIISSSEDKKFSTGETVTLLCTSAHTFHKLEVTWFKDGHALSGSDTSLHLGPLTAEDSGNYICALKTNLATLSEPYRLQVEAEEDATKMRIISSSDGKKFSTGETVTLLCTSAYTFHQLEVTWFKDGHALSGTDPFRQLGPLTAEDSGNYICALKANLKTRSEPYKLQVEAEEGVKLDTLTAVRLVLFTAHTLLIIAVASIIIKGRAVCRSAAGEQQKAERHLELQVNHVIEQPSDFTEELRTNEEE